MYQKKIEFIFGFVAVLFLLILFNSQSSAQTGESRTPLKIVQLGDSYSAGNGARSAEGDRNYHGVSGCYRSPTNWGSQFAESLSDVFAVTYINRACSGGVVSQISKPRNMGSDLKQWNGNCPTPDYPDEEYYKDTSLLRCTRFISPQIEAIDSSVDLVLMTMGGNDLGFNDIVKNCFVKGWRSADGCREAVGEANDKIEGLEDDLIETFADIRKKLESDATFAAIRDRLEPDARIAYVSYPHLLLYVQYQLVDNEGTEYEDIYNAGAEIRALASLGEAHQIAAVEAANIAAGEEYIVFYDGTKALFAGHEPNPSPEEQNPDRWLYEFEGSIFSPALSIGEWYHPNALGHENWGAALSVFETFGAAPGAFDTNADIDVVFVVDTTGSMGGEIAQVRADLSSLVGQLAATTDSYRVAVVSYRDFSERTGSSYDYPSRVDQIFTNDLNLIQAAIDSLTAQGGGDWEETVFSGIQAAIELPWRPGVTKIALVIGDAPALSPEPISNWTAPQIVANSIAVDPVQVIGVDVGYLNYNGALGQITDGTGGSILSGASDLTATILEILDQVAHQPFAWIGTAYSGRIGQPIQFDASGSYDPSGLPLTLYEWDFDGDGTYDLQTTEAVASHVYDADFNDFVVLRVTGPGGTALASARTVVNAEGYALQGDEAPCELDENGFSIIFDEETGSFLSCMPNNLPEDDQEGVSEIVDDSLDSALADLENAIDGLSPPAFRNKYNVIADAIESGNVASACASLQGMSALAEAQAGKKITEEEAAVVIEAVEELEGILDCSE